MRDQSNGEEPQDHVHYASRLDIVGVYQSVLSGLFNELPGLQGYGNRNPVWVTTLLEQAGFKLKSFLPASPRAEGRKEVFAAGGCRGLAGD